MSASGREARSALPRVILLFAVAIPLLASVPAAQAFTIAPQRSQDALAFWTSARMRHAKPLEGRPPGSAVIELQGRAAGRAGAPHVRPPLAPVAEATASAKFEAVPDSTTPATRVNGAIFIILPLGLARCSGTAVNAPNYSVVFTAGHCVKGGGRGGEWYDFRWIFVPGYRYGQRPFGVFPAKWIDTTRQWRTSGSENADVAAAVVTRNERGQLLGKAAGGAGIAWNLPPRQVFDVHGYPAAPPFNGETQRVCTQTPFLGHDTNSFLVPGPLNLAVDCNVTGGASGGGWTIRNGILNSVTNYGYPDDPGTDFGAYFGKEVGRLFHRAASVR